MTDIIVWEGAPKLREFLVPLTDLTRDPENPRRGEVEKIAESLGRFGQVRPVLVTASNVIVAGNHTSLAAEALGWTHLAVIPNDFASEGEARAYLLADNRLPELGQYEDSELLALLEEIEQTGTWEGTGYDSDDLENLRAAQDAIPETEPVPFAGDYALTPDQLAARAQRLAGGSAMNELVLLLDRSQAAQFDADLRVLQKEYGTTGVTETTVRALAEAALRENQA